MTETHYDVLKVSPDAPVEVIKASYAALIRRAHPDRGGDPDLARRINEAKDMLLNPDARASYDARLRAERGDPTGHAEEDVVADWGEDAGWSDDPAPEPSPFPGTVPPPFPGTVPPPFPGPPPPVTDATPPSFGGPPSPAPPPYGGPDVPPYGNVGSQPPPYDGTSSQRVPYGNVGQRAKVDTGPRLQLSNRQLWHGQTGAERVIAWAWLALTLIGPIGTTISALRGSDTNLVGNLVLYALLFAASLHVARERIVRSSLAKRYAVWVALAVLLAVSAGSSNVLVGLFFGLWAGCYVAAVELRRKRLWQQN